MSWTSITSGSPLIVWRVTSLNLNLAKNFLLTRSNVCELRKRNSILRAEKFSLGNDTGVHRWCHQDLPFYFVQKFAVGFYSRVLKTSRKLWSKRSQASAHHNAAYGFWQNAIRGVANFCPKCFDPAEQVVLFAYYIERLIFALFNFYARPVPVIVGRLMISLEKNWFPLQADLKCSATTTD
jgi:hypothetical protein